MAEAAANFAKLDPETVRRLEERLQELKKRRREEAEAIGIGEKVRFIVRVYGSCDIYGCTCDYETVINGRSARLVANCVHGQHVIIDGRTVYSEIDHKPDIYVPGPWVTAIINLYEAAKLKRAKQELEWRIRELEEEAARWGVRLEDLICGEYCEDAPF